MQIGGYRFQFGQIWRYTDLLVAGVIETSLLAIIAILVGLAIAVFGALAAGSRFPLLRMVIAAYVEVIRNTPILVQAFFIFYALPAIGLRFNPFTAAAIALTINNSAYCIEIVRAGIESIPRSQREAGLSLGMTGWQIFRYVILRPALKNIWPALGSQFTMILLATSIMSIVGVNDLAGNGGYIQTETLRAFEVYIVLTVIYGLLAFAFRLVFDLVGKLLFMQWRGRKPKPSGAASTALAMS